MLQTPGQAIERLQQAWTYRELRDALIHSVYFQRDPSVQAAIETARAKLKRIQKLRHVAKRVLAPVRQQSHAERIALLEKVRRERAGSVSTEAVEKEMKNICKDFRCVDCAESEEYKSICLQFLLECLAIRLATRQTFDLQNGYSIHPQVTAFQQRYIANPIGTWIHENARFNSLPDLLDEQYDTVVLPAVKTDSRTSRQEAREYRLHKDAIRKIIESIRRCERS